MQAPHKAYPYDRSYVVENPDGSVKVLDHGFVRLDHLDAEDLYVVNSARVSFGKRAETVEEADSKLIGYLMRERHGTPFEHNSFTFHVKAPIFIFREWQRHRIGSFNELSGRYAKLSEEWYIPDETAVRKRVGKPGNYSYEYTGDELALGFCAALSISCKSSYKDYLYALEKGIAPEQARLFLHVNHYSEMYWTVNARSMMNFLSLRAAPTAQWEIQQYAQATEWYFSQYMPVTYQAFIDNEKVAP